MLLLRGRRPACGLRRTPRAPRSITKTLQPARNAEYDSNAAVLGDL